MSSAKERAAARRTQLQQTRYCTIPITGYEDIYVVRYRIMGAQEYAAVAKRYQDIPDQVERELMNCAGTLVDACEEILEVTGPGEYTSTGERWSAAAARDLFGVETLPDTASGVDALLQVFPPTQTELLMHFAEYDAKVPATAANLDAVIQGESVASSAPAEQPISQ